MTDFGRGQLIEDPLVVVLGDALVASIRGGRRYDNATAHALYRGRILSEVRKSLSPTDADYVRALRRRPEAWNRAIGWNWHLSLQIPMPDAEYQEALEAWRKETEPQVKIALIYQLLHARPTCPINDFLGYCHDHMKDVVDLNLHYFEGQERLVDPNGPLATRHIEDQYAPKRILYVLVLKELDDSRSRPLLERFAKDSSELVRATAAEALRSFGGSRIGGV